MNGATGATSSFVERWPELFEGLSERQVAAAVHALAMTWAEGVDEPGYEDVKALTDVARGVLTREAYLAWARERARELTAGKG